MKQIFKTADYDVAKIDAEYVSYVNHVDGEFKIAQRDRKGQIIAEWLATEDEIDLIECGLPIAAREAAHKQWNWVRV